MPPEQKPALFSLDRSTLVPIGLLVSVVLASIAATTWIQRTLLTLDHKVEMLNTRLEALSTDMSNRWTLRDMTSWAELLQARNSALNVPIPKKDN